MLFYVHTQYYIHTPMTYTHTCEHTHVHARGDKTKQKFLLTYGHRHSTGTCVYMCVLLGYTRGVCFPVGVFEIHFHLMLSFVCFHECVTMYVIDKDR